MTISVANIVSRVRTQLIDTVTTYRWSDTELLQWLSDGCRSVVALAPGATSTTATMSCVAGTKQLIPTDGHMLLSITRNIAVDGVTAGRAVRIISREIIDAQNPTWHTDTPSPTVINYTFDPQEPKKFYCYPPNDGTGKLDIVYSQLPPELATLGDSINMQEVYQTALFDYVMFRAHQKDSDYAAGMQVAESYLAAFTAFMGTGEDSQTKANPNLLLAPSTGSSRGSGRQ